MRGLDIMKAGVIMSFSFGAGYSYSELNYVPKHIIEHQVKTAMTTQLLQMQAAPEVGRCIARTWNAATEEIKP